MTNEYKRPTKIIDLPSGKKVEIVAYLSQDDIDEVKKAMIAGQKVKGSKLANMENAEEQGQALLSEMEFDLDVIEEANRKTRKKAIRKLIDIDGTEYEATEENINEFIEATDGEALDKAINDISKKKQIEAK